MYLSSAEQCVIQNWIESISDEELLDAENNAKNVLLSMNTLSGKKILSYEERKDVSRAVEVLVRIECKKQKKGWWFRTKRRLQITQIYMGV